MFGLVLSTYIRWIIVLVSREIKHPAVIDPGNSPK